MEPIKFTPLILRLTRGLVLAGLYLCHTLDSLALYVALLAACSCSVVLKCFDAITSINETNSEPSASKLFALNQ